MNKRFLIVVAMIVIAAGLLVVLGLLRSKKDQPGTSVAVIGGADGPTAIYITEENDSMLAEFSYTSISMAEAKQIFETGTDLLIVDVRRADEFADGHIPGAINVANESIGNTMPSQLPDKDRTTYVYCRSGRRSKDAAAKLARLGYSNIIECGGILDWTGELEK